MNTMTGPSGEQASKCCLSSWVWLGKLVNRLVLEHINFSALSWPRHEGEGSLRVTILRTEEANGSQEDMTALSCCLVSVVLRSRAETLSPRDPMILSSFSLSFWTMITSYRDQMDREKLDKIIGSLGARLSNLNNLC